MATQEFRAEVRKVLNILANSLYTNREIFLRELISNASDALEKLRFRINSGEVPQNNAPLEIRISTDANNKTLTIKDSGIGMTAEELAENLGTIAKSGSEDFISAINNGENSQDASSIIGRFGIGFYSVFMVANKVEVTSKPAFVADSEQAKAHTWSSDGLGTFTVEESPEVAWDNTFGTTITLHLNDNAAEFLDVARVREIIRKHSAFVGFPIFVDEERANTQPALWREPKTNLTEDDYKAFYRHLTQEESDPLDYIHISVDVPVQFYGLIYIPAVEQSIMRLERDLWGLDLYSRRVPIQHSNKDLIPGWLSFLKGVVDTEDLPLNISRETLQENHILLKIQQTIVKQILSHLEKLASTNPEKYAQFWNIHRKIFKFAYQDFMQRERVTSLLRFNSSAMADAKTLTSLDEYMQRAPAGQKTFWFLSADNREAALLSPHYERFQSKNIEVLFLYDPVDEFVMAGLMSYKEWDFRSAENASADALKDFADQTTNTESKKEELSQEQIADFSKLLTKIKEILGDKVVDVREATGLTTSPAVLVSADKNMTASMEKTLRSMQAHVLGDDAPSKKILEINREHQLLRSLLAIYENNADDANIISMTNLLFENCLLRDGDLVDVQSFVRQTNDLLATAANLYAKANQISQWP